MYYTKTEENYLKAIYSLNIKHNKEISTNSLAQKLNSKASSITDMLKKLAVKKLVEYEKYKGVSLTNKGKKIAISIVRNHRLWEVFLVDKLNFKWDEVHELAEQLEHVNSEKLTENLNSFLGYPKFDPHGDPIPNKEGKLPKREESFLLSEIQKNQKGIIVGVKNSEIDFLRFLEDKQLILGKEITFVKEFSFDKSRSILMKNKELTLSEQVCKNIIIKINNK